MVEVEDLVSAARGGGGGGGAQGEREEVAAGASATSVRAGKAGDELLSRHIDRQKRKEE